MDNFAFFIYLFLNVSKINWNVLYLPRPEVHGSVLLLQQWILSHYHLNHCTRIYTPYFASTVLDALNHISANTNPAFRSWPVSKQKVIFMHFILESVYL